MLLYLYRRSGLSKNHTNSCKNFRHAHRYAIILIIIFRRKIRSVFPKPAAHIQAHKGLFLEFVFTPQNYIQFTALNNSYH